MSEKTQDAELARLRLTEANSLLGKMEKLITTSRQSEAVWLGRYVVDDDMNAAQLAQALREGPNPAEISDTYTNIRGPYDVYPLTRAAFEHAVDRAATALGVRDAHVSRQRAWRAENSREAVLIR